MSVQVDPMAASVVAAALSGTYPTLLPQWYLPPREAPLVGVQAHQDTAAAADQPLDLSAKPRNSQVSQRRAKIRARALLSLAFSHSVLRFFSNASDSSSVAAKSARRRIDQGQIVVVRYGHRLPIVMDHFVLIDDLSVVIDRD